MRATARIILAATLLAPLLAGCGRDPLVNGPFLIGAKRPDIRDGTCVPSDTVRSQDAHGDWVPCPVERTYGRPITQTAVEDEGAVDDPVRVAPRRAQRKVVVAAPSNGGQYGGDPRSAW